MSGDKTADDTFIFLPSMCVRTHAFIHFVILNE